MTLTKIYTHKNGGPILNDSAGPFIQHDSTDGKDYSEVIYKKFEDRMFDKYKLLSGDFENVEEGNYWGVTGLEAWDWALSHFAKNGVEVIVK